MTGRIGNGDTGGMGKPVGRTHHKVIKGELGIKIHGSGVLSFGFKSIQFLVTENNQFRVRVKNIFQGILNHGAVTAADHFPPEIGGGIENQVFQIGRASCRERV